MDEEKLRIVLSHLSRNTILDLGEEIFLDFLKSTEDMLNQDRLTLREFLRILKDIYDKSVFGFGYGIMLAYDKQYITREQYLKELYSIVAKVLVNRHGYTKENVLDKITWLNEAELEIAYIFLARRSDEIPSIAYKTDSQ